MRLGFHQFAFADQGNPGGVLGRSVFGRTPQALFGIGISFRRPPRSQKGTHHTVVSFGVGGLFGDHGREQIRR